MDHFLADHLNALLVLLITPSLLWNAVSLLRDSPLFDLFRLVGGYRIPTAAADDDDSSRSGHERTRRMARNSAAPRVCYYETLELQMDCTDEDIKKAYRRLALRWHPDKHSARLEEEAEADVAAADAEEAKRTVERKFVAIQQAYEVLIDPQERAWYDRHRDSILMGAERDEIHDEGEDVLPFFSTFCYSGYGTDEKGFYATYGQLFRKIADEDLPYQEKDHEAVHEAAPEFGGPEASLEAVRSFYAYWSSYTTAKTFGWLGEWDIREAPNRRILRLMEKDNKKARDAAKKKRNEEIRALADFVKKRDRRVAAFKRASEAKVQKNRAKAEEERKRQLAEHAAAASDYVDPEWMSIQELEEKLKRLELHYSDSEEDEDQESDLEESDLEKSDTDGGGDEDQDQLVRTAESELDRVPDQDGDQEEDKEEEEAAATNDIIFDLDGNVISDGLDGLGSRVGSIMCVACKKTFKSAKSYGNHEKSAKHRQMVAALKVVLEREESLMNGNKKNKNKKNKNTANDSKGTKQMGES